MGDESRGVIIVGAGHAGGTAAALLRQYGYTSPITLIGDEPIAPYQRPPLSKAWLKGEADASSLALKPDELYAEAGIGMMLGTKVTKLDRRLRTVSLADGRELA